MNADLSDIEKVAQIIFNSKKCIAFTGAGISVESGIPPFRGEGGLWDKYDPKFLDLHYFFDHPKSSWEVIYELFYTFYSQCEPNPAHKILADWEEKKLLHSIITQNIDNLHKQAGSKEVYEFHGNLARLLCSGCNSIFDASSFNFKVLPASCQFCGAVLKPDFTFFGEGIPENAFLQSFAAASSCDVMLIIGTSGEVSPANQLPKLAKDSGAIIIEINKDKSFYTNTITDYLLQGKASEILMKIDQSIQKINQ